MAYPFPGNYGWYNPLATIAAAGNIPVNSNPAYEITDFYTWYPKFQGKVPDDIINAFIAMANAVVNEARWHEQWRFGMALFVAHWVTLYMESESNANCSAAGIIASAQTKGLLTSKTAGNLSASYDYSQIDFAGWPMWKTTLYGRQFATIAKMFGKGGMYIW